MSRMRISIDCLYAFYHSLIPGDAFNHGDTHVSSRFSSAFFFATRTIMKRKDLSITSILTAHKIPQLINYTTVSCLLKFLFHFI
jgi:hypothetical protein